LRLSFSLFRLRFGALGGFDAAREGLAAAREREVGAVRSSRREGSSLVAGFRIGTEVVPPISWSNAESPKR
jgi:hypothetical protein